MPKGITGASYEMLNTITGSEPLLLVQLNFGAGVSYYCERKLEQDEGYPCKGKILSISEFTYQKKADSFGASGNVTITLDDADGEIKFAFDNTILEQKPIAIYIYYPGTALQDAMPLLSGRITSPITWGEGNRTVTFGAETEVQSKEIGYAPVPEDIQNLSQDAYLIAWPMIFGKCAHVQAVRIIGRTRGFLVSDVNLTSEIYKIDADKKQITFVDKCDVNSYVRDDESNVITSKNKLYVDGGATFPQDKAIKIICDNIVFEGSFKSGDPETFIVTQANVAKYDAVKIDKRGTINAGETEESIFWVADEKYQIAGLHCYFTGPTIDPKGEYNYCVKQIGKKCYLSTPMLTTAGVALKIDSRYKFSAYGTYRNGLTQDRNEQDVAAYTKILNQFTASSAAEADKSGKKDAISNWAKETLTKIAGQGNGFLSIAANEEVRLWDPNQQDVYVASLIPLESIDGVYGKKTHKFADGKVRTSFVPVPAAWYTSNLNDDEYNGVTTLKFYTPIQDHSNDGTTWDGEIYITGTSTVGPNISDCIKHVLTTYTDLAIDDFSFNLVHSSFVGKDANFMINNQEDALKVAEDLAWQARCVLIVDSGVAYLKYIATQPAPVMSFDNSSIQLKSIQESVTSFHEVKTKLIVNWYTNFRVSATPTRISGKKLQAFEEILKQLMPEFNRKIEGQEVYTFQNNTDLYGVITDEKQVRIFNEESSVKETADFWGNRYSNTWRVLSFKTFINALRLLPFDCISLNITGIGAFIGLGIIESISYDHEQKDVTLSVWLPIKAGSTVPSSEAWLE